MTILKNAACVVCVGAVVALVVLSRDGAAVRAASTVIAGDAETTSP